MNLLYPKLRLSWLPAMFGYCVLGGLLAGLYGILHDQVTYSIAPEYFTRFKFVQFHYADLGLPPRIFVGEIGFLASWWVGFIAAWFLARTTVPTFPPGQSRRYTLRGFGIVFAAAAGASVIGYLAGLGRSSNPDFSAWQEFASAHGIQDLPGFVRVAYIHNASYLGGLIGLVAAIIYLRRVKAQGGNPKAGDRAKGWLSITSSGQGTSRLPRSFVVPAGWLLIFGSGSLARAAAEGAWSWRSPLRSGRKSATLAPVHRYEI